jgi:hypothetical protein
LREAEHVIVEGAQGYGLSMYHGFYPYTTSRDVSVWQILADCGIPHDLLPTVMDLPDITVIGTCRTYPIRVANRFDTHGTQVGYSGPCYDDQLEISFEEIGQKVELTTVTKLPRRIFTFSEKQITEAVRYYDAVNFAARTKAAGIVTVGFIDTTCPPTGGYAAFNAVAGEKTIVNEPLSGHGVPPRSSEAMRSAILRHVSAANAK